MCMHVYSVLIIMLCFPFPSGIMENTHFIPVTPSDENKTLAITTEVRVAIMVSIVDFQGIMSMRVSTFWLTKGYPIKMKLSDSADVFDNNDYGA